MEEEQEQQQQQQQGEMELAAGLDGLLREGLQACVLRVAHLGRYGRLQPAHGAPEPADASSSGVCVEKVGPPRAMWVLILRSTPSQQDRSEQSAGFECLLG